MQVNKNLYLIKQILKYFKKYDVSLILKQKYKLNSFIIFFF